MHPYFQALFDLAEHPAATLCRVIRQDRGRVVVDDGAAQQQVTFRPRDYPIVGDFVAVADGHIVELFERRQCLTRFDASAPSGEQPIAANIDVVVIVQPAVPLNLARIERGVSLALKSGASALVAITKGDLADVEDEVRERVPTADVAVCSALNGEGLDVVAALVKDKTSVLIGPSGAGKSTLLNALLGEDVAPTKTVRAGDLKGRHTTTARQMYPLPQGGFIIDTPGTRALGLVLTDDHDDAPAGFDDIDTLAQHCRFGDCHHEDEPGCAVTAAVEGGTLDAERLKSYFRQARELRHLRETDHERRARGKKFAGMVSAVMAQKKGRR